VPGTGVVETMNFIALVKFKEKMSRERIAENLRGIETEAKDGIKFLDIYWTLGRYEAVVLIEAPDEKAAMKCALSRGDWAETETLVAMPAVEARKLVVE
jgi:uncharacterized protein with GYD domain